MYHSPLSIGYTPKSSKSWSISYVRSWQIRYQSWVPVSFPLSALCEFSVLQIPQHHVDLVQLFPFSSPQSMWIDLAGGIVCIFPCTMSRPPYCMFVDYADVPLCDALEQIPRHVCYLCAFSFSISGCSLEAVSGDKCHRCPIPSHGCISHSSCLRLAKGSCGKYCPRVLRLSCLTSLCPELRQLSYNIIL